MNAAITPNEQAFISSILRYGYLPTNQGVAIGDIATRLFPEDNTPGYSDADYQVFRMSINQIDQPARSNKRYVFANATTNDARKDAMDALFNEAYKNNRAAIIADAETIEGSRFYSPWKQAFVIDLPRVTRQFLSNHVVQLAIAVATFFVATASLYALYAFSVVFLHSTVIPALSFVATLLPPQASFIAIYATAIFNFIKANPLTCLGTSFLTSVIAEVIAHDPNALPSFRWVASAVNRIANFIFATCFSILTPRTHDAMIWANAGFSAIASFDITASIRGSLENHVEAALEHQSRVCKEKAYAVWMRIVEKGQVPALELQNVV